MKYLVAKISELLSWISRNIPKVLRFIFFGLLGTGLFVLFIGLIIVGALYFSGFEYAMMQIHSVLPNYFVPGIILGTLSVGILAFWALLSTVKKKPFPSPITFAAT